MTFLDWIGSPEGGRAIAGTLGGVVLSFFNWEGVFLTLRKVLVGTAMAYALGPTGVLLMKGGLGAVGINQMPENAEFATAFLIGVFGMVFIETGLRVFRLYRVQKSRGGSRA